MYSVPKFNLQHLSWKQIQIYMNDEGTSNIESKEHWVLLPMSKRNMEKLTHLIVLISMIGLSNAYWASFGFES